MNLNAQDSRIGPSKTERIFGKAEEENCNELHNWERERFHTFHGDARLLMLLEYTCKLSESCMLPARSLCFWPRGEGVKWIMPGLAPRARGVLPFPLSYLPV
jgi:hypothetical protein